MEGFSPTYAPEAVIPPVGLFSREIAEAVVFALDVRARAVVEGFATLVLSPDRFSFSQPAGSNSPYTSPPFADHISTHGALCDAGGAGRGRGGGRTVAAQSGERNRHRGRLFSLLVGQRTGDATESRCVIVFGETGAGGGEGRGRGSLFNGLTAGGAVARRRVRSLAIADVGRCARPIKGWRLRALSGVFQLVWSTVQLGRKSSHVRVLWPATGIYKCEYYLRFGPHPQEKQARTGESSSPEGATPPLRPGPPVSGIQIPPI